MAPVRTQHTQLLRQLHQAVVIPSIQSATAPIEGQNKRSASSADGPVLTANQATLEGVTRVENDELTVTVWNEV